MPVRHLQTFIFHALILLIACIPAKISAAPAKLDYIRTVQDMNWSYPRPDKTLKKIKIYAERQPYYPAQNLQNHFIDRPLYNDSSLREGNGEKNGFLRDVEVAKQYGLDGFAAICYESTHRNHLKYLQQENIKDYEHAFVIISSELSGNYYQRMRDMMIEAGKSPHTARIDGKIVCWNYGSSAPVSQGHLRTFITKLRADPQVPPFIIVAELPFLELYNTFNEKSSRGLEVTREDVENFRAKVRESLSIYDGLQLRCHEFYVDNAGEYPYHTLPTALWNKYIMPVLKEEIAKPEHKGKLLGLYARHGYINFGSASTDGQFGTEAIRTYLGEAAKINPDMIMLFEWNEAYENTSFQPTVSSGRTLERLIAYARSCYDATPPTPRPGDDATIPNLILSIPQCIRLGEVLHLELLNIPDGTFTGEVQAALRLLDGQGNTLITLPAEKIDPTKLRAVTWRFPAEQFAKVQAVNYELDIVHNGKSTTYKNFDFTRITPSTNIRYLYSRIPLREIFTPSKWSFNAVEQKDGSIHVKAALQGNEELASLEIIDNHQELYALDRNQEFDPGVYAVFQGRYTCSHQIGFLRGKLSVPETTKWQLRSARSAWESFNAGLTVNNQMRVNNYFSTGRGNFILKLPLSEMQKNPSFVMEYQGLPAISFDLNAVMKEGRQAKMLGQHIFMELHRADVLVDNPHPLNAADGTIDTVIRPRSKYPQLQLRAITRSGKIFRSPAISLRPAKGTLESMTIWSESTKKPVTISLPAQRIPDIKTVFSPAQGLFVNNTESPEWKISLAGNWDDAYSVARSIRAKGNKILPKEFVSYAPEWVKENGQWMLKFDGKGNYMVLPQEMIPRAAPFTLEFEIKRASANNEVLLRCGDYRDCGLELIISNGILKGAYFHTFHGYIKQFDTGLPVPANVWTTVKVIKSADRITFAVDGKSKTFDFAGRGSYFFWSAFGGHGGNSRWIPAGYQSFNGLLRKLQVRHNDSTIKR